jgi:hypothetical protein
MSRAKENEIVDYENFKELVKMKIITENYCKTGKK